MHIIFVESGWARRVLCTILLTNRNIIFTAQLKFYLQIFLCRTKQKRASLYGEVRQIGNDVRLYTEQKPTMVSFMQCWDCKHLSFIHDLYHPRKNRPRRKYYTGHLHGLIPHVFSAYSWIVLSLLNLPDPAVLRILILNHFSWSTNALSAAACK